MRRALPWICFAAIVVLAAVLRIYQLSELPAGFYCDEAGLGYNAYTIASQGTDEANKRFPLFFWSFGVSYKNPAFIYAGAPLVALFGPTELAIRLTSALFGLGTVIAMFFLGRAVMGVWAGVLAALFLAVVPWHLHFSRIAFELISFPFFFVIGLTNFVRYTQGRRTLWVAMLFFGLCFYAYKIANLFVPLFVIGATLLYLPTLLRRWRESLLAFVVLAAVIAPVAYFELSHQELSTKYFSNTTHLRPGESLATQVDRTWRYYQQFFSREFLFENGDPIVRHAVRGFGELYDFYLPFLLVGIVVALMRRDRASKLIVWWLVLYPVGASLMTEIPSATRAFIGAPAFCMLVAIGFLASLQILGFLAHFRPLRLALQGIALVAATYFFVPEVQAYLRAYWNDYPKYSAPTYGGFQYGYRQAIDYMEAHRDQYDILLMTAVEVNQPQIFPLYFRGVPPGQEDGYLILNPAEFSRYSPDKRILAALRPSDLDLFSEYEIKKTITAPGGQVEFVIADIKARKRFLTNWMILGLFKDEGEGMKTDFIDPQHVSRDRYQGGFGEIFWRRIAPQFVLVDLNQFFAHSDPRYPGNPERVCAYAAVTVRSESEQKAFFEISGTDDYFRIWLNGRDLTPFPITLGERGQRREIELRQGDNLLLLKTCENVGGWAFKARITDVQGKDLPNITTAAQLPEGEIVPPSSPDDVAVQLVEGFDRIVSFKRHHERHPDYRGESEGWWAMVSDNGGEVVWTSAAPAHRQHSILAFTASTSNEPGEAELFVDGKFALSFELSDERSVKTWRRGGYRLTFAPKAPTAGNSGVYLLDVPAEAITRGKPLEIRVIPARGAAEAWFALKAYRDTVAHEKLTPERAVEALRTGQGEEQTAEAPKLPEPKATPSPAAPAITPAAADRASSPAAAGTAAPGAAAGAASGAATEPNVRKFVYRGQPDAPAEGGSEQYPADGETVVDLDLGRSPEIGPNGEPVRADGVDFDERGGAYIAEDGAFVVPGVGDLLGDSGTISFTVEPGWDGSEEGDHALAQLRDPNSWENRVQVFKNGRYLRFLFTPDSGQESGVGVDVSHWVEGEPHHVTAAWSDGMTLLYVDGQLVGSQPYNGELKLPPGVPLYLGSDHPGGIPGADARLSGFKLYSRELSADEVGANAPR
ncbi:MAG TPA: LamG-like jellyroll fold domain-containing protein [Terriglobales bacterium]|nr:LamG-like jellyroll fold domain-containing protein [Terriglobales bacterium]